jgi:NitT/TauT family transport system permease protein
MMEQWLKGRSIHSIIPISIIPTFREAVFAGGFMISVWRRYRPIRIISPIAFLLIWEAVVRVGEINQLLVPAPASVLRTMLDMTMDGRLPWAIAVSLGRVLQGFIYGSALGIVLGLLVGWFRPFEDAVDPLVGAIYPIPKSALFPLFILWFGLGETSKVMTIMIGVVFLVLINTVTGVKAIDPVLLKAARDLGANRRQIFMKVVIPGALPNIFTGLRLGAGMALILVFITEIEATKAGLGYLLWESYQLLLVKQVFGCTIAFGILGILTTWILQWIEKAACPWRRS